MAVRWFPCLVPLAAWLVPLLALFHITTDTAASSDKRHSTHTELSQLQVDGLVLLQTRAHIEADPLRRVEAKVVQETYKPEYRNKRTRKGAASMQRRKKHTQGMQRRETYPAYAARKEYHGQGSKNGYFTQLSVSEANPTATILTSSASVAEVSRSTIAGVCCQDAANALLQSTASTSLAPTSAFAQTSEVQTRAAELEDVRERARRVRSLLKYGKTFDAKRQDPAESPLASPAEESEVLYPALLVNNNLGGLGPGGGPETMEYTVAIVDGANVNLIIENLTVYEPKNSSTNGMQDNFGIINIDAGHSTAFRGRLVDEATGAAYVLSNLHLHFADMDSGETGASAEHVMTCDLGDSTLTADTTVATNVYAGGCSDFGATYKGNASDDPTDPMALTELQADNSVKFSYFSVSEFNFTLLIEPGSGGRNFMFTTETNLDNFTEEDVDSLENNTSVSTNVSAATNDTSVNSSANASTATNNSTSPMSANASTSNGTSNDTAANATTANGTANATALNATTANSTSPSTTANATAGNQTNESLATPADALTTAPPAIGTTAPPALAAAATTLPAAASDQDVTTSIGASTTAAAGTTTTAAAATTTTAAAGTSTTAAAAATTTAAAAAAATTTQVASSDDAGSLPGGSVSGSAGSLIGTTTTPGVGGATTTTVSTTTTRGPAPQQLGLKAPPVWNRPLFWISLLVAAIIGLCYWTNLPVAPVAGEMPF